MDTFALDNFSAEEQQTFLESFQSYLRYDAYRDFVVNLDKVYNMIGFTQKANAKRLLLKYLKPNTDYTVSSGASSTGTGRNREIIMMTPAAFRYFSMVASTSKSRDICKYYLKLEAMAFKRVDHALQQLNGDVTNASAKIAELERQLNSMKHRTTNYASGSTVYIARETPTLFKVGSSEDMTSRAKKYYTSNQALVVYTRRCKDCRCIERVIHSKFAKYAYDNRVDLFNVPFEQLRQGVEEVIEFIEGELSPEYTLRVHNEVPQLEETTAQTVDEEKDTDTSAAVQTTTSPRGLPVICGETFDRFLEQCFDFVEGGVVSCVELSARYRLWGRCTSHYKDALAKHMMERGYDPVHSNRVNSLAYVGLQSKPLPPFTVNSDSADMARFICDCCVPHVTIGVSLKQLRETYIKWKQASDAEYQLTSADSKNLSMYCNTEFVTAVVYENKKMQYGFYGVCLKSRANPSGPSTHGNNKVVQQLHPDTGDVIREYDSITAAAKAVGCSIAGISLSIKRQTAIMGHRFRKVAATAPQQPVVA